MKVQRCEMPVRPQAEEGGWRAVRKSPLERKWDFRAHILGGDR